MYHDTLLASIVKADPQYKPLIPPSLHTRFTRAWLDKNARYKWAARLLEILRFTELLIEMGLRRKVSQRTRWRAIILLECIKCGLSYFAHAPVDRVIFQSRFEIQPLANHAETTSLATYSRTRLGSYLYSFQASQFLRLLRNPRPPEKQCDSAKSTPTFGCSRVKQLRCRRQLLAAESTHDFFGKASSCAGPCVVRATALGF